MKRVSSIDAMRGLAVLLMVWFQTWDFFSRDFNLYGAFWYRGFDFFNWLPMFIVVSGVCVWISVNSKLGKGWAWWKVFLHGLRRYGAYVALSLFICLWTLNLDVFLSLDEIVGAIGVYASIALLLILIFNRHRLLLLVATYFVSFLLRELFYSYFAGDPSLIVSQFFQGYTIWMMMPFFLTGVFIADKILYRNALRQGLFSEYKDRKVCLSCQRDLLDSKGIKYRGLLGQTRSIDRSVELH